MSTDRSATLVEGVFGDATYLMPAFFGGLPYPLPPARYRDTTNLTFGYNTDGDALQRLLPPRFTLTEPKLLVSLINNRGVEWLAGGAYNLLAINVPVQFEGDRDRLEGVFGLVVWENRTAPILMGREVQGVPKLFSEVDMLKEFPDGLVTSTAHFEGSRFARIMAEIGPVVPPAELEDIRRVMAHTNWFGWRHIPNVGAPGAALSHPVLFPQEFEVHAARAGTASIEWTPPDWMSNPTQTGVISALAALPNYGGGEALLVNCANILRADQARIPG